jgi:hypothetical protein
MVDPSIDRMALSRLNLVAAMLPHGPAADAFDKPPSPSLVCVPLEPPRSTEARD